MTTDALYLRAREPLTVEQRLPGQRDDQFLSPSLPAPPNHVLGVTLIDFRLTAHAICDSCCGFSP